MTTSSLVINFTPDPRTARPGGKYWIRLEPVEQKPPTATIGQVAAIADKLFEIEPCDDQGNGGEAHPAEMPSEQEVVKTTKEVLGHDPCGPDDTGAWSGQVKIYRSHQAESYRLVCANGKVLAITTHSEQVDTAIAVTGKTSVELEKPVYGNFTCDLPGAEIIGSTIWFGGQEFTGFVHVQYASSYDLAEISVNGIDDQPQTGHVVAFYHRLVAEADIEPPERDETTEQTLDCSASWHVDDEIYKPGRCLQKTRHTVRCECFGQEIIDTYETEEEVECPDYAQCPGGFIGCDWYYPIQDVTEYVPCSEVTYGPDGSVKRINRGDWEGYDPDYYEDKCCNPPDVSLPPCKTRVQVYRGGVEIEGGPEKYRQLYGDDVQLIGVTPENGICGQIITRQVVQQKNCCDEVTAIVWDDDRSVEVIADNSVGTVYVTGGRPPYTWSVRGSGFYFDADGDVRDAETDTGQIRVYTKDSCGPATITVTDGCSTATGYTRSAVGSWGNRRSIDACQWTDVWANWSLESSVTNKYTNVKGNRRQVQQVYVSGGGGYYDCGPGTTDSALVPRLCISDYAQTRVDVHCPEKPGHGHINPDNDARFTMWICKYDCFYLGQWKAITEYTYRSLELEDWQC